MNLILLIVVILLLFGGGGGYYAQGLTAGDRRVASGSSDLS